MKPSTKAELAINAMVELAMCKPAKPVTLAHLAQKQSISLSYLEQVFAVLRRSGLVASVRGPGGGYQLARSADQISADEIISPFDSDLGENSQGDGTSNSSDEVPSNVQEFWTFIYEQIVKVYQGVNLQDVVDGTYSTEYVLEQESAPQAAE